jgi:hypothetical protein
MTMIREKTAGRLPKRDDGQKMTKEVNDPSQTRTAAFGNLAAKHRPVTLGLGIVMTVSALLSLHYSA